MSNQVLVLNSDFTPLNVTTLWRGFVLVDKSRAEIISADEGNPIQTGIGEFARPLIIRLLNYVSFKRDKAKLTRHTIFARDAYVCQFVGCDNTKNLTIDHVHPKSRGGKNTWKNLVTACQSCNTWKDDRTPKEANMELKSTPYEPELSHFLMACNKRVQIAYERLMDSSNY